MADDTWRQQLARKARLSSLEMVTRAHASHIGSSLSVIDVLAVLYAGAADVAPATAESPGRDIVIVSKGHAAAATYSVLAHAGFFPVSWLDDFCVDGQFLMGHVTAGDIPGVEFSTGSLGHGLPFGVGVALADKLDERQRRVFVVMSDGECDEGSVWESALLAAHHRLDRITAIIDRNGLQSFESTETTLQLEPLRDKWSSFGWEVVTVDGHDHTQLTEALKFATVGRPKVVIAETIKGSGVSFMEGKVEWHYRSPDAEELGAAIGELGGANA